MGDVTELARSGNDSGIYPDGDECIVNAVKISCTVVDDSYFHDRNMF